jgi:E3 ubiquitin-protein ligase TRIP12
LTINEPERDPKGKKRAISDLNSDDDETPGPSTKRQRKSRSAVHSTQYHGMPKKSRYASAFFLFTEVIDILSSSASKGKAAAKAVASASSSRLEDNDVEMLDAEFREEFSDSEDHVMGMDEDTAGQTRDDGGEHDEDGGSSPPAIPGSISDASAMSIFGDYRQFGSYMMSLSSRLKTMLNNIKLTADPMTRLLTLQELSELLSISTEDTLAGSFPVEQFVKALVRILGGRDRDEDGEENGDNEDGEQDEDAALAAALAMSTGNDYPGDDNLECQVLACRCLANLMEALPGVAHTIVYHGAIPVLCSKLIEISYIDLAEQTLSVCSPPILPQGARLTLV